MYLYVKKSYALNDWCKPLAIACYSKGKTLPLIKPLEFQTPEGDAKLLSFQFKDYPAARIFRRSVRRARSRVSLHGSAAAKSGMYRLRTNRPAKLPQKSSKPVTADSTSLPEPPASAPNSKSPYARSSPGFFILCKNIFYNL